MTENGALTRLRWVPGLGRVSRTGHVFEDVLSEHFDALYRTARRLCRGREADAEDLLQDVALRGFRQFHELRDVGAARSWLFRILVRTHLNRSRSAARHAEVAIDDLDDAAFERALEDWRLPETPEDLLDRARREARLDAAIDALDAPLRIVTWLIDIEGFRQREAAAVLGVPEGTVASRLFRARSELRERLLSDGQKRSGRTYGEG